jgi:hypothetical protein
MVFALAGALVLLTGCTTRSISNSGFKSAYGGRGATSQIGTYSGELAELDVIGVATDTAVTEAEIQAAVQDRGGTKLSRASRILLIQSGADFPDAPMLDAMRARFAVSAFSGRPTTNENARQAFSKTLRLVAARGGYDKIVCYWGALESERKDKVTSTISWVPIVGSIIPDEREHMRLVLKAAIVDVASGRWTFVTPPPVASSTLSARLFREEVDQGLVEKLKAEGYASLARTLAEQHTE